MITPKKSSKFSKKSLIMTRTPSQFYSGENSNSPTNRSYREPQQIEVVESGDTDTKDKFLLAYKPNDYIESLKSYEDGEE